MRFILATHLLTLQQLHDTLAFTVPPTCKTKSPNNMKNNNNNPFKIPDFKVQMPSMNFSSASSQKNNNPSPDGNKQLEDELEKYKKRTLILQNVVEKLQSTNRQLLTKIKTLQEETAGSYVGDNDKQNIWPADMEVDMIRNEYATKEAEWERTLQLAQKKFKKMKDNAVAAATKVQELQDEIDFFQERAQIDEAEMVKMRKTLKERNEILNDAQIEINDLQAALEDMQNVNVSLEGTNKRLNGIIVSMQKRESEVSRSSKNSSSNEPEENENEEALKWKEQSIRARKKLEDLGKKWKERREDMEIIIVDQRATIRELEGALGNIKNEKIDMEKTLQVVNDEVRSLKDTVQNLQSDDVEVKMKKEIEEKAKESIEIAQAAVRQAQEREQEAKRLLSEKEDMYIAAKNENKALELENERTKKRLETELLKLEERLEMEQDFRSKEETLKLKVKELQDNLTYYKTQNQSLIAVKEALESDIATMNKNHRQAFLSQQADFDIKLLKEKKEYNELIQEFKVEIENLVNEREQTGLFKKLAGRLFRIGF